MSYLVSFIVTVLAAACAWPGACSDTPGFKCQGPVSSCRAMVGFVAGNKTTLSAVQKLFGIGDPTKLFAANGLAPSTPLTQSVNPSEVLKIPLNCSCSSSTGVTSDPPSYTVKKGDILDDIASKIFSHLVTYQQIATYNNIPDPSKIEVGQKLSIPLPCSCDQVGGAHVLHYAHVVAPATTVPGIAKQFNVTDDVLLSLNGIVNASSLQAYQLLDIPLPVCSSRVTNDSLDYPMLVPNGTYFYTAHNCVNCSCSFARNFTLQCSPSGLQGLTCPSVECNGIPLGTTNTTSGCSSTCSYMGVHDDGHIMIDTESCPIGFAPAKFISRTISLIPIFALLSAYIL